MKKKIQITGGHSMARGLTQSLSQSTRCRLRVAAEYFRLVLQIVILVISCARLIRRDNTHLRLAHPTVSPKTLCAHCGKLFRLAQLFSLDHDCKTLSLTKTTPTTKLSCGMEILAQQHKAQNSRVEWKFELGNKSNVRKTTYQPSKQHRDACIERALW